jgi:periplasmic protein TonB
MSALIYQPGKKWRFTTALAAAAMIHLAAIAFATANRGEPKTASGFSSEPPEIFVESLDPPDPQPDLSDPLPTPPAIDDSYVEDTETSPPVRTRISKSTPLVRPPSNPSSHSLNLSAAKVVALNAPRPEYPYEARRQKITGSGVAVMSIDPGSGNVTDVTMAKSTGSPFLDNAAIAGFRRWRFKPGSISTVTCPVTFTLSGASY